MLMDLSIRGGGVIMALFQLTLNSSLRSMMQMTLSWQSLMKAMKRRTLR